MADASEVRVVCGKCGSGDVYFVPCPVHEWAVASICHGCQACAHAWVTRDVNGDCLACGHSLRDAIRVMEAVSPQGAYRCVPPREGEQERGQRLYATLGLFDTRDGSPLADLVRSAREGWERSDPEMAEDDAWAEFDACRARLGQTGEPLASQSPDPSVASMLRLTASRLRDPEYHWYEHAAVTLERLAERLEQSGDANHEPDRSRERHPTDEYSRSELELELRIAWADRDAFAKAQNRAESLAERLEGTEESGV